MPRLPKHAGPILIEDLSGRVRPLVRHRLAGPAAAHGKHRRQPGRVFFLGSWGALAACIPLAWTVLMFATGLVQSDRGGGTRIIHGPPPSSQPAVERLQPAGDRPSITGSGTGGGTERPAAPAPTEAPRDAAPPATTAPAPTGSSSPTCPPGKNKTKKPKGKPSSLPILPGVLP